MKHTESQDVSVTVQAVQNKEGIFRGMMGLFLLHCTGPKQ